MTDPTADAAKLLPFPKIVERLREYADPNRDSGIYPIMLEVEEVRALLAGIDNRPQPAPPEGEPDFERLAEEIEDWMPDESPGEMSHKEYIRQFAAFLKNRIDFGINPCPLSADQIRYMVDRFLGWRLPKPWNPDNGISYVRPNYMHPPADHDWPTGTNLFDWSQAEAMVRYMVEGMPGLAARPKVEDAATLAVIGVLRGCGQTEAAEHVERLSGELVTGRAFADQCVTDIKELCDERDTLTAKLAEREAELAKVRADLRLLREYAGLPARIAERQTASGDRLGRLWKLLDEWDMRDARLAGSEYETGHAARQQQTAQGDAK